MIRAGKISESVETYESLVSYGFLVTACYSHCINNVSVN